MQIVNDAVNPVPNQVYCDPERFQEIMFHLFANAVKFNKSPGGKIIITLSMQAISFTNKKLKVQI